MKSFLQHCMEEDSAAPGTVNADVGKPEGGLGDRSKIDKRHEEFRKLFPNLLNVFQDNRKID